MLTKMCRKKQKPRQFFLFNDILVYGNILINKKKYNKQHIIPLDQVKLENLGDDGTGLKNGWLIRTPTKSFAVYAATATEKTEWMAHINKCVEDVLKKTGKCQAKEHAAVWVPDAEAGFCMHCRKTQFTMLNRRHHCRKCGAVVCGACSNRRFVLPAQSTKPLRVCLTCYDALSRAAALNMSCLTKVEVKAVQPSEKLSSPDSSGEDDSDDDEDNAKISADGLAKDLEGTTLDEKPTFYGDLDSSAEGDKSAEGNTLEACEENEGQYQSARSSQMSTTSSEGPNGAADPMAGGEPQPVAH